MDTEEVKDGSEASAGDILYIEDDVGLGRLVQRALQREGYNVRVVPDGAEGLEVLMRESFAAAIADYNLPQKTGLEILKSSRDMGKHTPFIILTGAGDEHIAVECMKAGAADYIVKDTAGGFLQLLPVVVARAIEEENLRQAKLKWEQEREQLIVELKAALAQVKQLQGLLPICAGCKRIRDDSGCWQQVEIYIQNHTEAEFTHSLCPDCIARLYPDIAQEMFPPTVPPVGL